MALTLRPKLLGLFQDLPHRGESGAMVSSGVMASMTGPAGRSTSSAKAVAGVLYQFLHFGERGFEPAEGQIDV